MPKRLLLPAIILLLALAALVLHWSGADGSTPAMPQAKAGSAQSESFVAPVPQDARAPGAPAESLQRMAVATGSERGASLHLAGRVVDAAGQPVPDQPLELLAAKPPANPDPHIQLVGNRSRDFLAAASTTTGPDGTFALAPPAGLALRLLPTGERRVFRQGPIELEPSAVDLALGDIVAQAACSIDGSVRDGSGHGIAGAELRCGPDGRWFDEANASKTSSAADGSFHCGGLDNGAFLMRVRAEGFAPQQRAVTLQPEQQLRGCDFELAAGGSIEGRVVDERDAPVAGATVSASSNAGPNTPAPAPVLSGIDGSFTLAGLVAPCSLRASKSGYRRASLDDVAVGRRDVVLRLQHMAMLTGSVVDPQDAPVAGSRVRAVPAGQSPDQDRISALFDPGVVTDAEGHFALPNPASGLYRVIASGDHLDAVALGVQVVQDQACAPLRIVVDRGGAARFAVVDPAGAPVAGAKVRVVEAGAPQQQRPMILIGGGGGGLDPDDFAPHRVWKGSTDAQGACTLHGLRPGSFRATVEAAAFVQPAPAQFAIAGSETVPVAVALAAAGFADVAVVDRDGVPLPGKRVEVEGPLGAGAERQFSVVADAGGKARVGPLLPGRWAAALGKTLDHEALGGGVALVTSGSGATHRGTRVEFAVTAGGTAEVRLVQPELSTLRGTLNGAEGAIANGSVQVQREETDPQGQSRFGLDGSARSTHTRPDGSFAIADLEPGRYRVRYGRQQQAMKAEQTLELPAGREAPVELRLRCGSLRVRMVKSDGAAVAGAQATLRRDGDPLPAKDPGIRDFAFDSAPTAQARSDGEGVATFADLPEGRYLVDVKAAHCLPATSAAVAVAAGGDPTAVAVPLRPAAWIAGTVVDAAGSDVAQAQVEWRAAAQATFTALAVSNGRFEIDGLEPGDYVLRARRTGRSATVAAPAFGGECTVHVELVPGPAVQLRVPD